MMGRREQLLKDIGIVGFVVTDLALYLDTHPADHSAVEYFNHYNNISRQMTKEFSSKYYPLTLSLAECGKDWDWGAAPLPWEGGCS